MNEPLSLASIIYPLIEQTERTSHPPSTYLLFTELTDGVALTIFVFLSPSPGQIPRIPCVLLCVAFCLFLFFFYVLHMRSVCVCEFCVLCICCC